MGAPVGNQNAAKDNRVIGEELRKAVTQGREKIRAAIEKQIDKAESGDLNALDWLTCRMEGKAIQAISGPDGGAIVVTRIELVPLGDGKG